MKLWWLSFVDPARPEGSRFVGGCIVDAGEDDTIVAAAAAARRKGCNPGGEVGGHRIPAPLAKFVADFCDRMLTRDDFRAVDAAIRASKTAFVPVPETAVDYLCPEHNR